MNANLTRALYICIQEHMMQLTDKDQYLLQRIKQLEELKANNLNNKNSNNIIIDDLKKENVSEEINKGAEEIIPDGSWSRLQGDDGHVEGDLDLLELDQ